MDERRHNMDGALFVDEERTSPSKGERRHRDEEEDERKVEDARRVTQGILDRMELDARAELREEDDERIVINIHGPDAGRAIGKKGQTLEALQFLVNKIVNREPEERRHIVLDSGNYRERHDNSLISMAKREAKRAVSMGKVITLEPMSARDRRVIHVSLSKFPGVSTRSEGEGSERRLQIIPARERGDRGERGDDRPRRDRGRGPARARDDRPRDDRPRDDRPRDDRPRDDRPRDDRPRDDRPRDDRPRGDRPRDDRPRDDRPREYDREPSRDDRPRDERPRERDDRPRDLDRERPRDERPRDERPRERDDRPRDDRPRDDRPRDDRPREYGERSRDDRDR